METATCWEKKGALVGLGLGLGSGFRPVGSILIVGVHGRLLSMDERWQSGQEDAEVLESFGNPSARKCTSSPHEAAVR